MAIISLRKMDSERSRCLPVIALAVLATLLPCGLAAQQSVAEPKAAQASDAGRRAAALRALAEALRNTELITDASVQLEAWAEIGEAQWRLGEHAASQESFRKALGLLAQLPVEHRASATQRIGLGRAYAGDVTSALEMAALLPEGEERHAILKSASSAAFENKDLARAVSIARMLPAEARWDHMVSQVMGCGASPGCTLDLAEAFVEQIESVRYRASAYEELANAAKYFHSGEEERARRYAAHAKELAAQIPPEEETVAKREPYTKPLKAEGLCVEEEGWSTEDMRLAREAIQLAENRRPQAAQDILPRLRSVNARDNVRVALVFHYVYDGGLADAQALLPAIEGDLCRGIAQKTLVEQLQSKNDFSAAHAMAQQIRNPRIRAEAYLHLGNFERERNLSQAAALLREAARLAASLDGKEADEALSILQAVEHYQAEAKLPEEAQRTRRMIADLEKKHRAPDSPYWRQREAMREYEGLEERLKRGDLEAALRMNALAEELEEAYPQDQRSPRFVKAEAMATRLADHGHILQALRYAGLLETPEERAFAFIGVARALTRFAPQN